MNGAALDGGKELMNLEPFVLLGAFGLTAVATVNRGDPNPYEFLGAILAGGFLALLFSFWKSRKRKADGIDTALWAMIALVGTMALAYFLAPTLDGKTIPVVAIVLNKPLAAFLIALSGTPAIEWMLTGEAFAWLRRIGDKFLPTGGA
jgi:drug/metabolite transporter (DMT)-like permease